MLSLFLIFFILNNFNFFLLLKRYIKFQIIFITFLIYYNKKFKIEEDKNNLSPTIPPALLFRRIQQYQQLQIQMLQRPLFTSNQPPFYFQAQHHYKTQNQQQNNQTAPLNLQYRTSAQVTPTLKKQKAFAFNNGNFDDNSQFSFVDLIKNTSRPKLILSR